MAELVTKCAEDSTQSCCQGTKAAFERRIAELDKEIEAIRNETHPELKRRKAALDARKQKKLKATELHLQTQLDVHNQLLEIEKQEARNKHREAVEKIKEEAQSRVSARLHRVKAKITKLSAAFPEGEGPEIVGNAERKLRNISTSSPNAPCTRNLRSKTKVLNLESNVGRGGVGVVGPGGKRRIVNPMCNVVKAIDEDSILDDLESMEGNTPNLSSSSTKQNGAR